MKTDNMNNRTYQVCKKCVMDTTDPDIQFDEHGICNHCSNFETNIRQNWFPNELGKNMLDQIVSKIKNSGKNNAYDCIIGLSGGVDSSYIAYKAIELGLKPLAVHVDAGWNSELAVKNIENLVKILNIDLYTHVIDWEEMRDLQAAYFRAGVANLDVPQDHAFSAGVYNFADKNKIKYILSGSNYATESILPKAWGYSAMDLRNLMAIHRKYGKRKLKTFPKLNFIKYHFFYPKIKKISVVRPLNYMPYNRSQAIAILENNVKWRYYGGKHHESRFTKLFQSYYLPTKFGYDKRKAHLSSLIVSGQITRNQAVNELKMPLYDEKELRNDLTFVIKKLGFSDEEFIKILNGPIHSYREYPNNEWIFNLIRYIQKQIK